MKRLLCIFRRHVPVRRSATRRVTLWDSGEQLDCTLTWLECERCGARMQDYEGDVRRVD